MKGLKKFTANMIMGANVASILLMLLVGYSDHLNPQAHPLLSCLGLAFPALLAINVCFLVFWAIFLCSCTHLFPLESRSFGKG